MELRSQRSKMKGYHLPVNCVAITCPSTCTTACVNLWGHRLPGNLYDHHLCDSLWNHCLPINLWDHCLPVNL